MSIKTSKFFEFLKGTHNRLGENSLIKYLPEELLEKIWIEYSISNYTDVELMKYEMIKVIREKIKNNKDNIIFTIDYACILGKLNVVKFLYTEFNKRGFTESSIDYACEYGHLDIVEWLKDGSCTSNAMDIACSNGHLHIVKWLHSNKEEFNCYSDKYIGCTSDAMDLAARNGHLDIVEWLHFNRPEFDYNSDYYIGCTTFATDWAAKKGHFDIVKWLCENRYEGFTIKALEMAADNGYFDIVRYLNFNFRVDYNELIFNYAEDYAIELQ